jgi:tetratricopeptide (TPR) repeat protein
MGGRGTAVEELARALRTLYDQADRPLFDKLIREGKEQGLPVTLSRSSLSDWLHGKSVPSSAKAFSFLVTFLEAEAVRRDPGHLRAKGFEWERLRAAASAERHANRGGRPRRGPASAFEVSPAAAPAAAGRPLAEFSDPFALEVHPAIDADPEAETGGLSALPVYVERDHDVVLRQAVERAAGGHSGIRVLVGGSSTGKTRACWESIHARERTATPVPLLDGWRLWHPIDPGRPEAALAELPRIGPRTVVWLNEAQHYLLTPSSDLGERVAAGLRELMRDPQRGPVLVLGTIWPEYWAALTSAPGPNSSDPHQQARALLAGTEVPVPEAFTGATLASVWSAAAADPRLAQAYRRAEGGRIAQYLAGVPALMQRYRTAPSAAKALIDTAIDARRLGHGLAVPHTLLEAAAHGYLSDQQWDGLSGDWFRQALDYCAAPCRGVPGPLTRIRPRPGQPDTGQPHYRLADYLEQSGRATRAALPVPRTLWDALTTHAARQDLDKLAQSATRRGLYRHAFLMCVAAGKVGGGAALMAGAELLEQARGTQEAVTWLRTRVGGGDPHAMQPLVVYLAKAGHTEEAIALSLGAARGGDTRALKSAARLIGDAKQAEDALALLLGAAERGDGDALSSAATLLRDLGRIEEALSLYRRAAEADDASALRHVVDLLVDAGRAHEAVTWLQARAENGSSMMAMLATKHLARMVYTTEAINWFQARAEAGDRQAQRLIAPLLEDTGHTERAITWYRARARSGDTEALAAVARLLDESDRSEEAFALCASAADAGDPSAVWWAGELLAHLAGTDQAISWLEASADDGNTEALKTAAWLFGEEGRIDEAAGWLQARAEGGGTEALAVAGQLLEEEGRVQEAIAFYERAADAGDTSALRPLACLLRDSGRTDEAIACFGLASEAGDMLAVRPTADLLVEAGRAAEAVSWLQAYADHSVEILQRAVDLLVEVKGIVETISWLQARAEDGDVHALREAGRALARAGHFDEAITHYQRAAERGAPLAQEQAVRLLEETGRNDEATRLRRFGFEPGGRIAAPWGIQEAQRPTASTAVGRAF